MKRKLTFVIALTLMFSCENKKQDAWPYGVNHEVFVLAFADGNCDGKGDLPGLDEGVQMTQSEITLPAKATVVLKN